MRRGKRDRGKGRRGKESGGEEREGEESKREGCDNILYKEVQCASQSALLVAAHTHSLTS